MKNSVHSDPFLEVDLTLATPGGGDSLAPQEDSLAAAADAVLAARSRAGDEEAFALLYERHRDAVTRVVRRWLLDLDAVDDAVQETFFKAWRSLDQFIDGDDAGRWLRRIAKNHCHDVWRTSRRRPFELLADGVVDDVSPETVPDCLDSMAVRAMLAGLTPRDAAMLVERHVEELPVPTLAVRWGLTRAATDVALHRARLRARRLATAQGLRGLVPGALLRRGASAWQRFAGSCCDAMAVVGEASAPLLIVAGLSLPAATTAAAQPPPPPIPAAAPARDDHASAGAMRHALPLVEAPVEESGGATSGPGAAPAAPAEPASAPSAPQGPAPNADFEPVDIPGTGRQVRRSPPPGDPTHEVGVRVRPIDKEASAEVGDEPKLKAVDDTTCTAARMGKPVGTFCKGGPSD
jgi:RNA polymerase sigma-70 factor (ECF subfamily)